jgi:hypothetical protein
MSKKIKKQRKKIKKNKCKSVKKKEEMIVVASAVDSSQKFYVASELADDNAIEQEMLGRAMEYFVYKFNQEGKEITGLSVQGVNETVRVLNRNPKYGYKIRMNPQYLVVNRDITQNGQKGVEVAVFAEDLVSGNSSWGIKFESYSKPLKRGGFYTDRFALEKALSKAERNAKSKLIPKQMVIEMIKKFMKRKENVLDLDIPSVDVKQIEAPKRGKTKEEDVYKMVCNVVKKLVDVSDLTALRSKLESSKLYSDEFKKKIKKVIVDEIKLRAKK